jgi:hypothetical protein
MVTIDCVTNGDPPKFKISNSFLSSENPRERLTVNYIKEVTQCRASWHRLKCGEPGNITALFVGRVSLL